MNRKFGELQTVFHDPLKIVLNTQLMIFELHPMTAEFQQGVT